MNDKHIFTFGPAQHPTKNAYVVITGVDAFAARRIMVALYGRNGDYAVHHGEAEYKQLLTAPHMNCVRVIQIPAEAPGTLRMADSVAVLLNYA